MIEILGKKLFRGEGAFSGETVMKEVTYYWDAALDANTVSIRDRILERKPIWEETWDWDRVRQYTWTIRFYGPHGHMSSYIDPVELSVAAGLGGYL